MVNFSEFTLTLRVCVVNSIQSEWFYVLMVWSDGPPTAPSTLPWSRAIATRYHHVLGWRHSTVMKRHHGP